MARHRLQNRREKLSAPIHAQSKDALSGSEFGRQCGHIVEDLDRVRSILNGAVTGLSADFSRIAEICAVPYDQPLEVGEAANLVREVEQRALIAVIELQFHDRVVQMLGNIVRRVEALARAAETNGQSGQWTEAGATQVLAEVVELQRRRPAPGGGEGDVELF